MLQEQFESAGSQHACARTIVLWTNGVGWFNPCNIRQSALTGISGNLKACSELFFFIIVRINQA